MVKDNPRLAGVLQGNGVGLALVVALNNTAIGSGVGLIQIASYLLKKTSKMEAG